MVDLTRIFLSVFRTNDVGIRGRPVLSVKSISILHRRLISLSYCGVGNIATQYISQA